MPRALRDVLGQACGDSREVHRFPGVLIGGEDSVLVDSQWRHQEMTPWKAIAQRPTDGAEQTKPQSRGADDAIAGALTDGYNLGKS